MKLDHTYLANNEYWNVWSFTSLHTMANSPSLSAYFMVWFELRTEKVMKAICRGFFHEKWSSTSAKQAGKCAAHRCFEGQGNWGSRHIQNSISSHLAEIFLLILSSLRFYYLLRTLRWPASWCSGQSLWLLTMRSRVRFPALPWEFSLKGKFPAVTTVWVA